MKFVNKTEEPIKVEIEGTDPKGWRTLKKGDGIEAKSSVYGKYYEESGLTSVEVKAVESKAGTKKVETKVREVPGKGKEHPTAPESEAELQKRTAGKEKKEEKK